MYDIIIVGCGPAGMTSAIYALRDGKKVLLLEKETIGGKISSSPKVENYPGFKEISGSELSNNLYEQVLSLGGQIEIEEVEKIIPSKIFKVITDMREYESKAIIIAVGSVYKKLGITNEDDYIGNGISFCTVCDGAFFKERIVAVVGGGNSAIVNSLSLANICKKIYLIVRKDFLKGSKIQIEEINNTKNIEVLFNTNVTKLHGENELTSITINTNGLEKDINIDGMFLAIGQSPATKFLDNVVELSSDNYIKSDGDCITNIPGLFVAGDCKDKKVRQLTTAVSDGTIAALNALSYLKEIKD